MRPPIEAASLILLGLPTQLNPHMAGEIGPAMFQHACRPSVRIAAIHKLWRLARTGPPGAMFGHGHQVTA